MEAVQRTGARHPDTFWGRIGRLSNPTDAEIIDRAKSAGGDWVSAVNEHHRSGSLEDAGPRQMLQGIPVAGALVDPTGGTKFLERNYPQTTAVNHTLGAIGVTVPFMAAAPHAFGVGAGQSLLTRIGLGAASNGTIAGADTAARGGSAEDIVRNTGIGTAIGGAAPVAVSALGATIRGIGAGLRYGSKAVQNAQNPTQAAIERIGDKMAEGGINPAALADTYAPQVPAQLQALGITQEQAADIVARGLRGEAQASIAASYPAVSPFTIRSYINAYREANPTPLNIADMAKAEGAGLAKPVTDLGRAAANIAPQPEVLQGLIDRQINQPGRAYGIVNQATGGAGTTAEVRAAEEALPQRAVNVIEREYPGQTFEVRAQQLDQAAREQAQRSYRDLYAQPDVVANEDLARLMIQPLARRQWERARMLGEAQGETIPTYDEMAMAFGFRPKGGIGLVPKQGGGAGSEINAAEAQNWEIRQPFEAAPTPEIRIPVRALDYFQRALRLDAEKGGTEGYALNAMRQRFINALDGGSNPLVPNFRSTMSNYRAGMEGQDALRAGAALTPELSPATRDAIAEFQSMTPTQQELFRMGFARHLQDMIRNGGDAASQIDKLNRPGAQNIIRQVFPSGVADRIINGLSEEAVTSRAMQSGMDMSKNLGSGSQGMLYEFQRMMPEQKELFRMGFARGLMNRISNRMESADVTRQFSTDAVRQMIRAIYPSKVAEPLITRLSRESVTSEALRDIFGNSTTARQILDQGKLMEGSQAAADMITGRWQTVVKNFASKVANQIGERQAQEIQRVLLTTEPDRVLPYLNQLARSARTAQERQSYLALMREGRATLPFIMGMRTWSLAQQQQPRQKDQ